MIREDIGDVVNATLIRVEAPGYFLCRPAGLAGLTPLQAEAVILYDPSVEAWIGTHEQLRAQRA